MSDDEGEHMSAVVPQDDMKNAELDLGTTHTANKKDMNKFLQKF